MKTIPLAQLRATAFADLRELGEVLVIVSAYGVAGVVVALWIGIALRVVLWAAGFR